MTRSVYIWHDAIHTSHESARLQYWRLSFIPDFDRESIFRELHNLLDQFSIRSYIIYETFGRFDLLLRLWVPREHDPEDFGLAVSQALEPKSLWESEYLLVTSVERHWAWSTKRNDGRPPALSIEEILEADENKIAELDSYNTRVLKKELASPPSWLSGFISRGLVGEISLDSAGVRFFATFGQPRRPYRREERQDALRRIANECDRALTWATERFDLPNAPQLSLYAGYGTMTDFLILARAPDGEFYDFSRELIFGLRNVGLDRLYRVRPYTHIIAERNFTEFAEKPLANVSGQIVDATILAKPESATLEFKATYTTNFRRFMETGVKTADSKMVDSVIKTICGFLNSPRGGLLVIGVLEVGRELERIRRTSAQSDYLNKLRETSVLSEEITDGEEIPPNLKAVLGLEFEYRVGSIHDIDSFSRAIEQKLLSSIEPNPLALIQISNFEFKERTVATIAVRPADAWFYAEVNGAKQFFVREVTSTRPYSGTAAQFYQRANPRMSGT